MTKKKHQSPVYCSECMYYYIHKSPDYCRQRKECHCAENMGSTFEAPFYRECFLANNNNDCKHFKRGTPTIEKESFFQSLLNDSSL